MLTNGICLMGEDARVSQNERVRTTEPEAAASADN